MRLSHHEINAVVLEDIEVVDSREPNGIGGSVEFVVKEATEKLFLLVVELCLVKHADVVLFQVLKDRVYDLGVFCRISLVELVDGLECFL